jgi:hypothetical protein
MVDAPPVAWRICRFHSIASSAHKLTHQARKRAANLAGYFFPSAGPRAELSRYSPIFSRPAG